MKNNHSGINQKSNFVLSQMFYNQISTKANSKKDI